MVKQPKTPKQCTSRIKALRREISKFEKMRKTLGKKKTKKKKRRVKKRKRR